jgi:hypothetical protein
MLIVAILGGLILLIANGFEHQSSFILDLHKMGAVMKESNAVKYKRLAWRIFVRIFLMLLVITPFLFLFNSSLKYLALCAFFIDFLLVIVCMGWGHDPRFPVIKHYASAKVAETYARAHLYSYGLSDDKYRKIGILMFFDWLPYSQICSRALMMSRDGDVKLIQGR